MYWNCHILYTWIYITDSNSFNFNTSFENFGLYWWILERRNMSTIKDEKALYQNLRKISRELDGCSDSRPRETPTNSCPWNASRDSRSPRNPQKHDTVNPSNTNGWRWMFIAPPPYLVIEKLDELSSGSAEGEIRRFFRICSAEKRKVTGT